MSSNNKKSKLQTLKGFRDFLPEEAIKRQSVIDKLRAVFELYGFNPLETPALEYAQILEGKYGNEGEKLIYKFKDRGGRDVAMRYDQTVPLARVIAQYGDKLPMPFKRNQIQPVWRAEKPQKGRYREFTQCDIDIFGTTSPLADAEIIVCTLNTIKALGFKDKYSVRMRINDREIFKGLDKQEIIAIDKMDKIGPGGVIKELKKLGKTTKEASNLLDKLNKSKKTKRLNQLFETLTEYGLKEKIDFWFDKTLARGLEYYTSTIFELELCEKEIGVTRRKLSLAGGGRYDNLVEQLGGPDVPAVGISFGLDRICDVTKELDLLKDEIKPATKALVTIFSDRGLKPASLDGGGKAEKRLADFSLRSIETANKLRAAGINTELYPDPEAKLDKQLKYADKKGIPYVIIIGPEEVEKGVVTVRNMVKKTQKQVGLDNLIEMWYK